MLKTLVNIVCGLALFRGGSCGDVLALVVSLLKSFQIEDDCEKKVTGAGTRIVMTSFDRVLMYDDFHELHTYSPLLLLSSTQLNAGGKGRRSRNFWKDIASIASDGKYLWVFNGQTGDLYCFGTGYDGSNTKCQQYPITPERVGQAWDDDIIAACKSRAYGFSLLVFWAIVVSGYSMATLAIQSGCLANLLQDEAAAVVINNTERD